MMVGHLPSSCTGTPGPPAPAGPPHAALDCFALKETSNRLHVNSESCKMGTHVHPWLIHVNVWQKPLQYCKVISLQLK